MKARLVRLGRAALRIAATIGGLLALSIVPLLSQLILHPLAGLPREPADRPPPGFVALDVAGEPPLSCWLGLPAAPARRTVVFAHGLGADRLQLARVGVEVVRRGGAALLCDLRAHGASGDAPTTYGPGEAADLRRALRAAEAAGAPAGEVTSVGFSLGGAAAARLAWDEPTVDRLALLSTFPSTREILHHYGVKYYAGLIPGPVADLALALAGLRAGFTPDQPSTQEIVAARRWPTLLVHGEQDTQLPFRWHGQLCGAAGPTAICRPVPAAEHVDLFAVGGAALERELAAFALATPPP